MNGELVHAQLCDLQRARIVSATFDVVCERGAQNVKVAHVVDRSGVSRRTFYEVFGDREDCLLAAFNDGVAYVCERVLPAYRAARGGWRGRVRGALVALLGFLDEQPLVARLLVCESLAGGDRVLGQRVRLLADVARVIDQGRQQANSNGAAVAVSLTAEGVLGGVLAVIHARLLEADHDSLIDLVNPLMSMIVLPYLGVAAARRELDRRTPTTSPPTTTNDNDNDNDPAIATAAANADGRRHGDGGGAGAGGSSPVLLAQSFRATGLRLTYRVVRVLLAIAEHPGGSNRVIGHAADAADQGQISKLLARLQRARLITNTRTNPDKSAPNSWQLTNNGRQITNSIPKQPAQHPATRDRNDRSRPGRPQQRAWQTKQERVTAGDGNTATAR